MEDKSKATEEMERSDPGNLKLSRVRLKSVILVVVVVVVVVMMMMIIIIIIIIIYACLTGGLHDILSARHTSTVLLCVEWLKDGSEAGTNCLSLLC